MMEDDDCIILSSDEEESFPVSKSSPKKNSKIIHLTSVKPPQILSKTNGKFKNKSDNEVEEEIIEISDGEDDHVQAKEEAYVISDCPASMEVTSEDVPKVLDIQSATCSSPALVNGVEKVLSNVEDECTNGDSDVMEVNEVADNHEIVEEEGDADSVVGSDDFQTDASTEISTLLLVLKPLLSVKDYPTVEKKIWNRYKILCTEPLEIHSRLAVKIIVARNKIKNQPKKLWQYIKELLAEIDPQKLRDEQPLLETEVDLEVESEAERVKREEKLKKTIERLENQMNKISQKIKELDEEDVDWDAEDDHNSSYLQRDRLMAQYTKALYLACELTGSSKLTGRPVQVMMDISKTTQYPEIENAVQKMVNSNGYLYAPDFCDIHDIVSHQAKESNLHLNDDDVKTLSKDLFKKVINIIKSRRLRDVKLAYPENCDNLSDDPASTSEELRKELEENRLRETSIQQVITQFAELQDTTPEGDAMLDASDSQTDDDEDDELDASDNESVNGGISAAVALLGDGGNGVKAKDEPLLEQEEDLDSNAVALEKYKADTATEVIENIVMKSEDNCLNVAPEESAPASELVTEKNSEISSSSLNVLSNGHRTKEIQENDEEEHPPKRQKMDT